MFVKEKSEIISSVLEKIYTFVQTEKTLQEDLNDYLRMIQVDRSSQKQMPNALLPYIFERRIGKSRKSIFDIFEQKQSDLTKEEQDIAEALKNSTASVFEVKKIFKDGFEVYNIVNELTCRALVLEKMTAFRGVASVQFLVARLFKLKDEFYIFQISEIIPYQLKEKAYRLAVAKQMQKPELLYKNNDEKLKEIKKLVKDTGKKFQDFFHSSEIITTSQYVDNLISSFNDYVEEGIKTDYEELKNNINEPESLKYFEVKELTTYQGDFLQSATKGFASHKQNYDVGIVYDDKLGLFVVPFLKTFRHVFDTADYKLVEGYKECVENYVKSPKIPPSVLESEYDKDNDKFLKIVNECTDEELTSFDELVSKYKSDFKKNKSFSSTTILYASKAFQELMGFIEKEEAPQAQKVGRNDPCPCGSGKKFKKCCLSKVAV